MSWLEWRALLGAWVPSQSPLRETLFGLCFLFAFCDGLLGRFFVESPTGDSTRALLFVYFLQLFTW